MFQASVSKGLIPIEQVDNAIQKSEQDMSTNFTVYMMDKEFGKSGK